MHVRPAVHIRHRAGDYGIARPVRAAQQHGPFRECKRNPALEGQGPGEIPPRRKVQPSIRRQGTDGKLYGVRVVRHAVPRRAEIPDRQRAGFPPRPEGQLFPQGRALQTERIRRVRRQAKEGKDVAVPLPDLFAVEKDAVRLRRVIGRVISQFQTYGSRAHK